MTDIDNLGDGCYKCKHCLECTEDACIYDLDDTLEVVLPRETYHKWDNFQESLLKNCLDLSDKQLAWIFDVSINAIIMRRHKLGLSKEKKC